MSAKTLTELKDHLVSKAMEVNGIASAAWLFNYEQIPDATYPRIEIMRDIPNSNIDSHSITRGGAWDTYNIIVSVSDNSDQVLSAEIDDVDMETALRRYLYSFLYKAFGRSTQGDFTLLSGIDIPVTYMPRNNNTQRAEVTAKIKVKVFVGSAGSFS
jgi:hypothetical protein